MKFLASTISLNLEVTDRLVQASDTPKDDLLLTPTAVFAFSFVDKVWRTLHVLFDNTHLAFFHTVEFNVEVEPVVWNEDAFANLVLPDNRKELLQSLVEAHYKKLGFDDFIKGNGHGLVVKLFGPPGVGKTFSAEATSEHVKGPLYVIGGGDLGTTASALDVALERIFDVR